MQSPIFWVHQLTQVLTLYSSNLSIAVVNDVMKTSKNLEVTTYEKLQSQYEVVRGVLSICLPAIFGVIMDLSSKLWKFLKFPTKHDDLKYSLIFSALHGVGLLILAGSIYHDNVWFFLLMPSIILSTMKCIFFTSVNFCYPNSSIGIVLATPDLISLGLFWTSSYIITAVQKYNNLNIYFYSQIGIV